MATITDESIRRNRHARRKHLAASMENSRQYHQEYENQCLSHAAGRKTDRHRRAHDPVYANLTASKIEEGGASPPHFPLCTRSKIPRYDKATLTISGSMPRITSACDRKTHRLSIWLCEQTMSKHLPNIFIKNITHSSVSPRSPTSMRRSRKASSVWRCSSTVAADSAGGKRIQRISG